MSKFILEERGNFWLPTENYDSSVPGVLKIDESGLTSLELKEKNFNFPHQDSMNDFLIFGILDNNKQVIISEIEYNDKFWKIFSASKCLVSNKKFLLEKENLYFRKLSISLKGYEKWFNLNSKVRLRQKNNEKDLHIVYKKPENITYNIDDDQLSFIFNYTCNGEPPLLLEEMVSLSYSSCVNQPLDFFRLKYHLLRDLFILLTGSEYTFHGWPEIYTSSEEENGFTFYFIRYRNEVKIPNWYEFDIIFNEVKENFGDLFINWQENMKKYEAGFYNYFSSLRGIVLYTEHEFLSNIQGLESFYNKKYPPKKEEDKNKLDSILAKIENEEDRLWIKDRLKPHLMPLGDKITNLITSLPINFQADKIKKFAIECADIRNVISHGDKYIEFYDIVIILIKKSGRN